MSTATFADDEAFRLQLDSVIVLVTALPASGIATSVSFVPLQLPGSGAVVPPRPVLGGTYGEPEAGLLTLPGEPLETRWSRTVCGEADGLSARYSAAAPATCGVAIDVPLIARESESDPIHADVMFEPGAKMSRQLPTLEKSDRASVLVVDPTVMASGVRAGDVPHASAP